MRTTKIWNISLPPEMARAAEKAAKEEARTKIGTDPGGAQTIPLGKTMEGIAALR